MEIKVLFSIIFFASIVYFYFGGGSRLLKKKSHHYIVPPDPKKDRKWIPVDFEAYKKEIYIDKTNIKRAAEQITSLLAPAFPEISEETDEAIETETVVLDYALREEANWIIIEFFNTNFFTFHDTIWLFDDHFKTEVIGLCQNASAPSKDYTVIFDRESGEPHLIGAFRDERNFGIYLPKAALDVQGNISASSVREVSFTRTVYKLPVSEKSNA